MLIEAVQQRAEIAGQVAFYPLLRGQTRIRYQRRQQCLLMVIDVQERGHGHQTLAGLQAGRRIIPPQRCEHLFIGGVAFDRLLIVAVVIADRRDFAQDAEITAIQPCIASNQLFQPAVYRGRCRHSRGTVRA